MKFGMMIDDHRVDIAVLDAVARKGIEQATLADVMQTLGWSRSAFYRAFESWEARMQSVYEDALGVVSNWIPTRHGDRRTQFEAWWSMLMKFFACPHGRALRAMRVVAMRRRENFEDFEITQLKCLREWVGRKSNVVAKATWALLLLAGGATEAEAHELREMAWATLAVDLQPVEGEELGELSLLAEPIFDAH